MIIDKVRAANVLVQSQIGQSATVPAFDNRLKGIINFWRDAMHMQTINCRTNTMALCTAAFHMDSAIWGFQQVQQLNCTDNRATERCIWCVVFVVCNTFPF